MRKWLFFGGGGLLVLVGLLMLPLRYLKVSAAACSYMSIAGLILMSVALLAYYGESHMLGALIPGCVLAGLSLGLLLTNWLGKLGALFIPGGLGAGFFAVALVDAKVAGHRQVWAFIAGAVLLGLGVLLALASSRGGGQSLGVLAGAALLLVGVWIAVRQARSAKKA
jgi:hypothetical protein